MPVSARHNHFTSYNRRRISNDAAPLVKRIEDQLPLVVTLGENNNSGGAGTGSSSNTNGNPCCAVMHRQLALATSREENQLEEIDRLKTKLKSKSKRYKEKLQEQAKQHRAEVEAKDEEIERLKAQLEAAQKANAAKEEGESTKKTSSKEERRRKTYRRSSWSERSLQRQSSAGTRKSNNSLRGLRSWAKLANPRDNLNGSSNNNLVATRSFAFSAGGQKPSKSDLQ